MQLFILHVYVYVTVVCMCLSVECVYVSLRHVCVGGDKVISAIRISQWISIIRFCQEKQLSSYISYKHIEGPPPVSIDRNTSNLHTHTHICTHILNYSSCIALAQFVWRWEIDFQSFLSRFRLLILCMHNCICFCNKEERASCVHVQRPKANSSSTTNLQWIKYLFSRNNVITNCLGDYCVLIQHYCRFFCRGSFYKDPYISEDLKCISSSSFSPSLSLLFTNYGKTYTIWQRKGTAAYSCMQPSRVRERVCCPLI